MKLFWIFLFTRFSEIFTQEWIDPHDMNTNSKRNLKKSSSTGELNDFQYKCDKLNVEENNSVIYLRRFINLLLSSAVIDKSDPMKYHGQVHFSLDDEKFKFLTEFSNNKNIDLTHLRKLDTVLSEMFDKSYLQDISGMFFSSQEMIFNFLFSKNSLPLLGLSVFLYISYNLFRSNFSVWYVFRYFIFIVVLIDFVQRYQYLYQEVEEHNMHVEYSSKCDTNKMNWFEYFKFITGQRDCEKRVASLLEVGLLQVKSLIIVPLSAVGTGMGYFASELWSKLPFPWNILIFPIMLIFCAIIMAIGMTVMNDTPFKINLMHMFHLEFGDKNRGITMDKMFELLRSRHMVEDVKDKIKEKNPPKKKYPPKAVKNKQDVPAKDKVKKSEKDIDKKSVTPKKDEECVCDTTL